MPIHATRLGGKYMIENEVEFDKKCPICGEIVRSDANVHEFCKLCGMGISDPEFAPRYETSNGEILYFCCDYCLGIYKFEFDKDYVENIKGGIKNEEL
jgi:hypothetical protein